jgi:hypothetical protein
LRVGDKRVLAVVKAFLLGLPGLGEVLHRHTTRNSLRWRRPHSSAGAYQPAGSFGQVRGSSPAVVDEHCAFWTLASYGFR